MNYNLNEDDFLGNCISYRLLRYGEQDFLYSAVTDRIYVIEPSVAKTIQQIGQDAKMLYELELGCSDRYRPCNPESPNLEVQHTQVLRALNEEVQQIVLGVTENCNLRCRYCIYSGNYKKVRKHSSSRMPWHIARKAVDYLLQHCSRSPIPPGIAFYGGEPFLEFALIKKCVKYAKSRSNDQVKFVVTTNGTLLNRKIRDYVVENKFSLIVSLDGPQIIHDRHRRTVDDCPTFDRITANLRALREEAPEYFASNVRFSVVLAPPVDFNALEDFFDASDIPCMVSPLEMYGLHDIEQQKSDQRIFEHLGKSFEQGLCNMKTGKKGGLSPSVWRKFSFSLLGLQLHQIQTRSELQDVAYYRLGQCIPGVRKIFVNTRGEMYPCEKVEGSSEVCIGHVDTGVDINAVEGLLVKFMEIIRHNCTGCWMRRMCRACLADVVQGGHFEQDKMRVRCSARLNAQARVLGLYAKLITNDPKSLESLREFFPFI